MTALVWWGIGLLAALVVIHLALRWMEARNWVYYRRTPRHGGPQYHLLHMSSVFDPRFRHAMEIIVADERHQDESGDPPGKARDGEDQVLHGD